jgi:dihydroneopterin aldolase
MDRIFIENLRLECQVGVTEQERSRAQKIILDLSLDLELSKAAASKKLADTVDYREVQRQVSLFVSSGEFLLLESLADGVATVVLDGFKVERVRVRARKEKYSVEPSIGIEVERSRRRSTR